MKQKRLASQAASRVFVCRRECAAASVLRGKTLTEGEFTSPEHFNPNGPQRDHPVGRKPGCEEQKAALEARL